MALKKVNQCKAIIKPANRKPTSIFFGTLKEVYDYVSGKGTPDINDLLFTIYGALPIFVINLLLANSNP
jgi:hypothetical protein